MICPHHDDPDRPPVLDEEWEIARSAGVDPQSYAAFRSLKRVMTLYRQLAFTVFEGAGVHPGQAACLFIVASKPGLSQRELADRLYVSPPTVTTMLQKMERAGFIERRPDSADQRLMRIWPTDKGSKAARALGEVFADHMKTMFDGFTDEELAQFAQLMERLGSNVAQWLPLWRAEKRPAGNEE
jgi:DNA-binding MarR family transcriptional regulator